MKIQHIWSVLCKESVINQDDNVISLFGVLEEVNSTVTSIKPNLPRPEKVTIPFNFELVSYWTKDLSEEVKMQIKTTIIDPDDKEIANDVKESIFPINMRKLRSRLKVQGLSVTKSGDYSFRISLKINNEKDYKVVSEIPLSVKIQFDELIPPSN